MLLCDSETAIETLSVSTKMSTNQCVRVCVWAPTAKTNFHVDYILSIVVWLTIITDKSHLRDS